MALKCKKKKDFSYGEGLLPVYLLVSREMND